MREASTTSSELADKASVTRPAGLRGVGADLSGAGRRSGPAAAAVLAAGIACFADGLLSILSAASGSVTEALTLSERVGYVSGLSTATTATFLAAWGGLAIVWRHADPPLARVALVSGVLVGLGLLATFPPVFNAFG
jgi:hypothetical protein